MQTTRLLRLLLAGTAIAVTTGCDVPSDPTVPHGAQPLELHVLGEPTVNYIYFGLPDRRRVVIRTRDAWESFWNEATAGVTPGPPVPSVDFGSYMVIVAGAGTKPTSGYGVRVDAVHEREGRIYVQVREVSPGATCGTYQAFTSPTTAVRVPRRDGSAVFLESAEVTTCD